MAEYGELALWWAGRRAGPIDRVQLPISQSLREDIAAWAEKYDRTLNKESPDESGFSNAKEEEEFEVEGRELWERLSRELPEYEVLYFSEVQQRLLRH
jgi:hypothetical protein